MKLQVLRKVYTINTDLHTSYIKPTYKLHFTYELQYVDCKRNFLHAKHSFRRRY